MGDQSYIKLFRSLRDWEWWNDANVKATWVTILVMANWKDKRWKGVDIGKGSFFTSIDHLSKEIGLSIQQTRTALKKLKSTGEITTKATNGGTLVTVVNWEKYQELNGTATSEATSGVTSDQQTNNKRPTNEQQQLKNNKNNKNTKKDIYKGLPDELVSALKDFEEMRKASKAPMTDKARQLILANLTKLAGDDVALKVKILEQSISNSWKGVFPLKEESYATKSTNTARSYQKRRGYRDGDGRSENLNGDSEDEGGSIPMAETI